MTYSILLSSKDTENSKETLKNIVKKITSSLPKTTNYFFPHFKNHLDKVENKTDGMDKSVLV